LFDIEKVKKHLLKICKNTKKPDPITSTNIGKMWTRRDIVVELDVDETKEFYVAIEEILKDDFFKKNFSVKFLEKKLEDILSEALKLKEQERSNFIKKELTNLKIYLQNEIREWIFIVPINNLSIKRTFSVGNIKFYVINNYRKKKIENILLNILKNNKNYTDTDNQKKKILRDVQKIYINPISGSTCAEVKVKGVLDYAQELAFHRIRLAISALKLYAYPNDDSYKRYFGVFGEVICPANRVCLRYTVDGKRFNPSVEKIGYLNQFLLDKDRIKFMKANGFNKLNEMLKKTNPNNVESRLLTSIYWFGKAMSLQVYYDKDKIYGDYTKKHENLTYFEFSERFIKLFTALECLLILGNREPISTNLTRRSALLLAKDYDKRKKIKKRVRDLYTKRSSIVHHGEEFIPKSDLAYLTTLVQAAIITFIKIKDRYNLRNQQDLGSYFEKLELS
jgi:hypothetical protein